MLPDKLKGQKKLNHLQTILGANGQIAEELARELKRNYTSDIKLVSRHPKKINETDSLFTANLLDREKTNEAVKGSEIAYRDMHKDRNYLNLN